MVSHFKKRITFCQIHTIWYAHEFDLFCCWLIHGIICIIRNYILLPELSQLLNVHFSIYPEDLLQLMNMLMKYTFIWLACNSCEFSPLKCSKNLLKRRTVGRIVRFKFYTQYYIPLSCNFWCAISYLSALTYDMEKHCNTEIAAKVVRVSSNPNGT